MLTLFVVLRDGILIERSRMTIDPLQLYHSSYGGVDLEQEPQQRQVTPFNPMRKLLAQHEKCNNPVLKQVLQELDDTQNTYGKLHPKVAEAWNALGLILVHMERDADEARRCHECALAIFKEVHFAKETAITLNDLGYCYERLDQRDVALENYQGALRILKSENLADDHARVISTKRAVLRIQREL